jgi:hypothetical protein
MNAANPKCACGEALHSEVLQVGLKKRGEGGDVTAALFLVCRSNELGLTCLANVFFMAPPRRNIASLYWSDGTNSGAILLSVWLPPLEVRGMANEKQRHLNGRPDDRKGEKPRRAQRFSCFLNSLTSPSQAN